MPTTIADIAKKAGVSKSTVSRYLNERYECMSAATKERIATVIEEEDYRPNALARSLKRKKTYTIAVILANILNPFSASIIRGIEDYCQKTGFNLILCNTDDNAEKEKSYVQVLLDKQIDGLIINTTGKNNALLGSIRQNMPVVLIDRGVSKLKCDTVLVDNILGMHLLMNHLISLGHRRIAFFTMPFRGISPRSERVKGYKEALEEQNIPFQEELLVETDTSEEAVKDKLRMLFSSPGLCPTVIFGYNNLMTMSIIKVLKKMKLAIPDEAAVVGFDDWEWAAVLEPPVTVIAQPAYAMGEKAAWLVINRFEKGNWNGKPISFIFEPKLIVRKSCGG